MGIIAADDHQAMVIDVPDGANERLWEDFATKTGVLRNEHLGRHQGHWRKVCMTTGWRSGGS